MAHWRWQQHKACEMARSRGSQRSSSVGILGQRSVAYLFNIHHGMVAEQAEPDDEDEAEDSDGEDFLLKGPRSDLELRCSHILIILYLGSESTESLT